MASLTVTWIGSIILLQEAFEWYKKAAEHNNEDAIKVLMPIFRKALRKRNFYIWKGITIFASWFSAYVYLFLAIAFIGCILAVIWNQERKAAGLMEDDNLDTDLAIRTAIKAFEKMIEN